MPITADQVRALAEKLRDRSAETLSTIVRIPSFSGKEEAVCRRISQLCTEAGFDDVRFDGLGSVIGRVGTGPRKLAIDAHIDTVGVGDPTRWTTDPFSGIIRDGLVLGRGTADQKGGAAAMITAGRMLKELGYDGEFSVYFTFTVLEEDCDGLCWRYLIEKEGLKPDLAVSTEPTSCRLYRGQRGRMEIEATVRGISAHGSAPERGESAAYKAARAVIAMEKLNERLAFDDFLGKGTVVVSKVDVRGPSQCAVPDQGSIYLDRRLTWGETAELAISEVKAAMAADAERVAMPVYEGKGWHGATYVQDLYFPTWKIEESHPLVAGGRAAHRALFGRDPEVGKWTFSTNGVAICGKHGVPCIGFGPGDEDKAHAPNEHTRVADLVTCSAFYAMLPVALEAQGR
ncbi:MAG TPA: YgeY family selenium metabolism-linked hydrolase [Spirochaetia bacterium]|nr:YgeY family selenium metabolism-linked hydrolase [Spirochaetia bacterium]